ncbi:MAG: PEGA domain-containing protein [Treponema sp.]|nr:PEGA domain-containing protein [Treponema sp.]
MNRLNKFSLILLFSLFSLNAFSQDLNIGGISYGHDTPKPPAIKEEKMSSLRVTSNPSNAKVYFDGVYKGNTPLTIENISQGYHRVKVEKEHYREENERIYFSGKSRRSCHARLVQISGYLRAYSDPSGASLSVNGSSYKQGSLLELDEGYYTIKARKFGYEETSQRVYISRLHTTTHTISMSKAAFRLESVSSNRTRFNPQNPGSLASVKITARVNAPEIGLLTVSDSNGTEIFSTPLSFTTWTYNYYWRGTDSYGTPVSDGLYKIEIQAAGQSSSCIVTVDSSLVYPGLSLTNGGSGIGSVASAESFPEDTSFLEIDAGLILNNSTKSVYQVPLSLGFLWVPSEHFELGLAFRPYLNGEDSVINFSSSIKLTFQAPLTDYTSLCFGVLGRVGFATGTLYQPYGIDSGNGSGFGAVLGLKTGDLYVGAETSLIINPTSGLLTGSDDRIWKTGLAVKKQFDSGSLGLFAALNVADGDYNYTVTHDETDYNVSGSYDGECVWEAGFEGSWFIFSSPSQFVFRGGTYIMPQNTDTRLIYPHVQIGLKFLF